ncbi:subtilisin-like protein [Anaeromyces robustus]|uniref:Subtilisin-like protein n=1 Tax=Anaeromyces robustus TaxID=1754192 RepID=A0A1Y1XRV8_9FUNG|nr:subtilisin-like protein [Anaeromyces robustus]|eukprot:ORX88226.1 subtilisin-like protein [Anaeromyces robustus]
MNNFLFFISILLFNCIIGVYSKNANYIVAILRNKNDDNYDDANPNIQDKIDELVNDRMNDIYDIINKNKNTYISSDGKQDEKLEELKSNPLEKRSNHESTKLLFVNKRKRINKNSNGLSSEKPNFSKNSTIEYIPFESVLVNHICPVLNYYAINVYLSEETAEIVRKMENVIFCEESKKLKLSDTPQKNNNHDDDDDDDDDDDEINSNGNYYDIDAIKKETQWSDVSVQENISFIPNHLSLLSHNPFTNPNKTIDNNFYYPSSAGKGIDIYLIDEGIITDHDDFNTYEGTSDERTITCDAIFKTYDVHYTTDEEKNSCTGIDEYPDHGILVSSMAGGTLYGVSKKANLHMIAIDFSSISILKSFDHIVQYGKSHKTVINLSLGLYGYNKVMDDKLSELIDKDFIIIVSSDNESRNCCADPSSDSFVGFVGYRKAIAVGATETDQNGHGQKIASYSNYGECVDIFAPGGVTYPVIDEEEGSTDGFGYQQGTSCSSPLVVGIAASIMSEHPEIKFNNEKMRKALIELSIKDVIYGLKDETPNRFVNNGKQRIYSPDDSTIKCGTSSSNNAICSDGCCTKDGECITFENNPGEKCFIENGCQSEFGYCTTEEDIIKECEDELKTNEECLIKISSDMKNEDGITQCNILNTEKCKEFYNNLISGKSVCSLAKNYKEFEFIDQFDINKFNKYNYEYCLDKYYTDEIFRCQSDILDYLSCLISEGINILDNNNNISRCIAIKSDLCRSFYEDPKKALTNVPSCKNLYNLNLPEIMEALQNFDDDSINETLNYTDEYDNICDELFENSVEKCNKELEQYEECLIDFPEDISDLTDEELKEKCYLYQSEKCMKIYNSYSVELPICKYAEEIQSFPLVESIRKNVENYYDICFKTNNSYLKETAISDCFDLLEKGNKCLFDLTDKPSKDELFEKCDMLYSEECSVEAAINNSPSCRLAENYSDEVLSKINEYMTNHITYDEICEATNDIDSAIESCEMDLKTYKYCDLSEYPMDDDTDLKYRCMNFNFGSCQKFYDNPYSIAPSCFVAQLYKDFNIYGKSNETFEYYEDICTSEDNDNDNGNDNNINTTTEILEEPTPTESLIKSTFYSVRRNDYNNYYKIDFYNIN